MNREKLATCLTATVVAAAVSIGAAGCFATAFALEISGGGFLVPLCAGAALLASVLLSLRYGSAVMACLLALGALYCLRLGTAAEQFRQLTQQIFEIYASAYGWNILPMAQQSLTTMAHWPVGIYGAAAAAATALCIVRRKRLWLCLPVVLLPLSSIIVVTDTVPREGYLMALLWGVILLLLTHAVREENAVQGNRLTAAVALPVAAALALVFFLVPQKNYVNQSIPFRDGILQKIQTLPDRMDATLTRLASDLQKTYPRQIDLADLGDRDPSDHPVLEITSDRSETIYLRGQDFDSYDGMEWKATGSRRETFGLAGEAAATITIKTRSEKEISYLPYYPQSAQTLIDGAARSEPGVRSATYACSRLPENWRLTAYSSGEEIAADVAEAYLALPDATDRGARAILEGLYAPDAGNTEKAEIIAALVMNSAEYSLNPQPMPQGTEDFALWFVRESDAGYCIHFATAATVLLRAADVPARYVTGYMIETEAGKTVTASEENAHAWAEYYEPRLGCWIVLESTPASGLPTEPTVPTVAEPEPTGQTSPEEPTEMPTLSDQTRIPEIPEPTETTRIPAATEVPSDSVPVPDAVVNFLRLLKLVLGAVVVGLLAGVAVLQRRVRLRLRRNRSLRGSVNQQALALWQESSRLSRLAGEAVPEELLHLAERAKFSQHTLTQEQLQCFITHNRRCIRILRQKPWYRRLVDQYIRAAY